MNAARGSSSWRAFPPHVLRDYALIADGRRGALCGPRGELVWLCAPRWDSPAVLSSLMGGEGTFAITPTDAFVWGGYYEPGSLIWRNRWTTTRTRVECREALALPAREHCLVVLRRIDAVEGTVRLHVRLDLRADFGQEAMRDVRKDEHGMWTMETGDLSARLVGLPEAEFRGGEIRADVVVLGGRHHDVMLEIADQPLSEPPPVPDEAWTRTERSWAAAVPSLDRTAAPRDSRLAYAVLHGLTTPGGGTVAAATLGLPERAEQGRNYDYRYVWLRDQCYVGLAAGVREPTPLFDEAVKVVTARLIEHGPEVAPAYRVDGTRLPEESTLRLSGYPGGTDVVGNWVTDQFQLDALGEAMLLLALARRYDRLDDAGRRALGIAVDVVRSRWEEPDAGMWELQGAWWTHSRLACVAGLRAAADGADARERQRWTALADTMLSETDRRARHPSGRWQRSSADTEVDAALLLPPVRGALPATDSRTTKTLAAVGEDLVEDGYVYRYRPSHRPLGLDEGAFLLCGFMMSLALWQQGKVREAMRFFERSRAACGSPGLFSEEYDVQQHQLRGNLPQAFTHAMLLETAQRLAD